MKAMKAGLGFVFSMLLIVAVTMALMIKTEYRGPDCQEDDAWIAVDHHASDAVEDQHGVSRACRNVDQMLDSAVEVYIQNQP